MATGQSPKAMLISGLLLGGFAIVGALLVAFTFDRTEQPIADARRAALLRALHELVPPRMHDNDIFSDHIEVHDSLLLGSDEPVAVYRARRAGQPVAAVLAPVAPDGYTGNIHLLVAIDQAGKLLGVRVTQHRETPGLGDAIEAERSDWIRIFEGRSLRDPTAEKWKVKRDGGVFDQLTGATITPRAVVRAVRACLEYYAQHRETLFQPTATSP